MVGYRLLTPLSTTFQLNHDCQFYLVQKGIRVLIKKPPIYHKLDHIKLYLVYLVILLVMETN
jgi:hypothetical protein